MIEPGKDCPTCKRRVPHPKKDTSPATKVVGIRVPTDDADTFAELVDAAAEHLGGKGKPHHRYWTLHYGLVALLQSDDLKGAMA